MFFVLDSRCCCYAGCDFDLGVGQTSKPLGATLWGKRPNTMMPARSNKIGQTDLVASNGLLTESLVTGPEAVKAIPAEARDELFTLFPDLRHIEDRPADHKAPMRRVPRGAAGRRLVERHIRNQKELVMRA